MKLANVRDLVLGSAVIAFAIFGLWQASALPMGDASEMQAGYFPRAIFAVLLALGAACLMRAARPASAAHEPNPGWPRALAAVTGALVLFALTIEALGLPLAALLLCLVAALGNSATRYGETLALAVLLAGGSTVLFVVALGVPMPIWPH